MLRFVTLTAFLTLFLACSSSTPTKTETPDEDKDWFCEMGETEEQWACVRDDNPIPSKRPTPVKPETVTLPPAYTSATATPLPQQAVDPQPVISNATQPAPAASKKAPKKAENLPLHKALAYRPEKPTSMLELPGNFWAVQMVAVSSKEALEEYAKVKKLSGMSAARVANKDKLFYVLLLGIYETRDLAERAVASIPNDFEKFDPWIRPLSGLQKAMVRGDELAGTSKID